jgi:aspartate/methionine/tyrosine aminotransferase
MSKQQLSWLGLSLDFWRAGLEAQQVIGLRLAMLAAGGEAAVAETSRMLTEKTEAALEVQQMAASAALNGDAALIPARTVALYRRRMRANRKRLAASGGAGKGGPR